MKSEIVPTRNPDAEAQLTSEVFKARELLHRKKAAELVFKGNAIAIFAIQYGAVFAAEDETLTFKLLEQVKGGERKGPAAVFIPDPEEIIESGIVDLKNIHPDFHELFVDPALLAQRTQGICMLRFPINPDSQLYGVPLHSAITKEDEDCLWLQILYMGHNQPFTQNLIEDIYNKGTKITAISSLNIHRGDTPTDHQEALLFCEERKIPMLISDYGTRFTDRSGSYPIIKVGKEGAVLERAGNVHPGFLQAIGWDNLIVPDYVQSSILDFSQEEISAFQTIWNETPFLANLVIRATAEGEEELLSNKFVKFFLPLFSNS